MTRSTPRPAAATATRPEIVAYQGVSGAFSEQAALQFAPNAETVGFTTFEEAFEAAVSGR